MSPEFAATSPVTPLAFVRREIPRLTPATDDRERERARRQGHALGYAEGLRAAATEAEQTAARTEAMLAERLAADAEVVAAARAALEGAAASLRERSAMIAELAEETIWTLALDVAEAILHTELSSPVRAARTAVVRAERAAADHAFADHGATNQADAVRADAVVVLSTVDLATLDRLGERPQTLTVEAAADLSPGDAVVRLADGEIDLRVDGALERARAALADVAADAVAEVGE